jgi:hypothetical protein
MTDDNFRRGDSPRAEPEIIPPGQSYDPARGQSYIDPMTGERVYVAKIGPFGMFLIALGVGLVLVAILVFLVGAFLLWIPVVGLLIAAGLVAGVLRPYLQKRG